MLRKKGVVDKFVEFFGPGLSSLGLADRATIANMAPEYGATMGFFPVDAETIRYLERTGRDAHTVKVAEAYFKAQGLFRTDATPDPEFTATLELDLSTVKSSMAGPKRPQDLVPLDALKRNFYVNLPALMSPKTPAARRERGGGRVFALDGRGRRQRHARRTRRRYWKTSAGGRVRARWRDVPPARRLGGDRRDHQLHQYLQSLGDDRRRPPREEGPRARACAPSPGSRPAWRPAPAW